MREEYNWHQEREEKNPWVKRIIWSKRLVCGLQRERVFPQRSLLSTYRHINFPLSDREDWGCKLRRIKLTHTYMDTHIKTGFTAGMQRWFPPCSTTPLIKDDEVPVALSAVGKHMCSGAYFWACFCWRVYMCEFLNLFESCLLPHCK